MRKTLTTLLTALAVAVLGISPGGAAAQAPQVRLPADEGPHPTVVEWWYYVGEATGTNAAGQTQNFGFLITFSRTAGVTVADFQLTNLTNGAHYSEGNVYPASNFALPSGGIRVNAGPWTAVGANGSYQVRGGSQNGAEAVNLQTSSSKPAALMGNGGFMKPYGTVGSTYYYSWTDLQLAGTIRHHGQDFTIKQGRGWADHQWFNPEPLTGMADLSWDWFAIQLADGRQYMIYLTRNHGREIVNPQGNVVDAQGRSTPLDPAKLGVVALGHWTSPDTGKTYSSGWKVSVPGGEFVIKPKQLNQESAQVLTPPASYRAPQLWEGVCAVTGIIDGKPVSGRSFTEILPPTFG